MSIAAISSAFVTHVRSRSDGATPPTAPVQAVDAVGPQRQGRRHELVDAMAQAMGVESPDRKTQQALFRFAHALMHDLRAVAAPEDAVPGAGRAWGRQSWSDLGSRLDALATAAGATAPPSESGGEAGSEAVATPTDAAAGSAAPAIAAAAAAAGDAEAAQPAPAAGAELAPPQPLTRTTAALWLTQVPSSRLLEAFATLSQALPAAGEATADARSALAAFLQKLSAAVTPTAVPEPTAGSLFHATA